MQEHDFKLLESKDSLIGVDEVGRGALAGPVVAAACRIHKDCFRIPDFLEQTAKIRDSKKMSAKAREEAVSYLRSLKASGLIDFEVSSASVPEINSLNILKASILAMERSLRALINRLAPSEHFEVLVDGKPLKGFFCAHESIIGGDDRSLCIAFASILAKVTRDQYMLSQEEAFPEYQFARHKGYGTKVHRESLLMHGPCEMHRELFLRKIIKNG